MLSEISVNDLLLVEKSFYHIDNISGYYKIKEGSILLVIENNFGATFKDRYVVFLLEDKKLLFNSKGLVHVNSSNLKKCLKLLRK